MNNFLPGLYIVSTPIGNLDDITLRALKVLKNSDKILCEDTRRSIKLLNHYNINNKLISHHKFNEKKTASTILENIKNGEVISMISDAGTPTISDPGLVLIKECIKNNLKIFPMICYEAIFPSRIGKTNTFDVIINITNDHWFGDTFGPHQHHVLAKQRAIETGLSLIHI